MKHLINILNEQFYKIKIKVSNVKSLQTIELSNHQNLRQVQCSVIWYYLKIKSQKFLIKVSRLNDNDLF